MIFSNLTCYTIDQYKSHFEKKKTKHYSDPIKCDGYLRADTSLNKETQDCKGITENKLST